jgi:excisionase family DNA binding protein
MPLSPKDIDAVKLYTVLECAQIFGVTEQTVRKLLREKRLVGKKIGRRWHIRGSELRRLIGE